MRLFTPFTIPQKDNCDLCRIKTKKENQLRIHSQITFLETFTGRDLISFSTDLSQQKKKELWVYKNEMPKNVRDKEEKIKSSSVNFMQTVEIIQDQRVINKLGT